MKPSIEPPTSVTAESGPSELERGRDSVGVPRELTVTGAAGGKRREETWRVVRAVGAGESAEVFEVETPRGRRALKWARADFEEVMEREARVLHAVGGGGVPRLFEVVLVRAPSGDERIGLALEWIEGPSLREAFESLVGEEAERVAEKILVELGATLREVHGLGWAHGDVKPDNVLLRADGSPVLIDWGLVGSAGAHGSSGGTPRYLPPEWLEASSVVGALADTWALALVALETALPELRRDAQLAEAAQKQLPAPWEARLRPFLEPKPGRRASLAWGVSSELGVSDEEAGREARHRAIRQAYVRTRSFEIESAVLHAATCPRLGPSFDGESAVRRWLEESLDFFEGLSSSLKTRALSKPGEVVRITDATALDRARFVSFLTGLGAWDLPLARGSDVELVESLGAFAEHDSLEAWSGSWGGDGSQKGLASAAVDDEPAGEATWTEWTLRLTERPVSPALLRRLEKRADLPERLRVEVARILRRHGELDRAALVLEGTACTAAEVERAVILLRQGQGETAEALLAALHPSAGSREEGMVLALLARRRLDGGDVEGTLEALEGAPASAPVCEVRALAELMRGELGHAERALQEGSGLSLHDEQEARLEGVRGMIEHSRGEPEKARLAFAKAAELARRAGARLEEATYLTGLAAAASDAGELGECLRAAERAEALFDALGRRRERARALLARASVLSLLEMDAELRVVAGRTFELARQHGDERCAGYAALCLVDGLRDRSERLHAAGRASEWLGRAASADRLRAEARWLELGEWESWAAHSGEDIAAVDERARRVEEREARIEWWKARAVALGDEATETAADPVLRELLLLASEARNSIALGPALVAGSELALVVGRTRDARRLLARAAPLAQRFVEGLSDQERVRALELGWVKKAQSLSRSEFAPEQLGEVEALLRSLGQREGLRPLLRQILDALLLWTGVERGLLLLPAPGGRLVVRAARNLRRADLEGDQIDLSRSMAERALAEGRPVLAVDAVRDLSDQYKSVHTLQLRSVLALPLMARGRVVGVAYLDDRVRRGAFGEREVSWAGLIATIAALTINDERDRLELLRALRRAKRAEARLADELSDKSVELERTERELSRVQTGSELRGNYAGIIMVSRPMRSLLALVDRVAGSEIPVLINGESGTGKELVARALAQNGGRRDKPFVAENCAAVPENLLESTLFGHVRGAFTGATQNRAGLFEVANGGTLLLDEIGEMSLPMQAKLLRVLQDGEIHKVGSERSQKVNVRVLAATHRDLEALVKAGKFREDLYYRLAVVTLRVPALRERPEDIAPLALHFLKKHGGAEGAKRSFSRPALDCLRSYAWPGNVRQLENEVRRLVVLGGVEIVRGDLSAEVLGAEPLGPVGTTLKEQVDALERRLVVEALEDTRGNRTRAAEALGLSRFGLQKMIQRLQISESPKTSGSLRILGDGLDEDR